MGNVYSFHVSKGKFLILYYVAFESQFELFITLQVETIGDAYMLVSGLPKRNGNRHSREIADCAIDIMASIDTFCIPHQPTVKLKIRIGKGRRMQSILNI